MARLRAELSRSDTEIPRPELAFPDPSAFKAKPEACLEKRFVAIQASHNNHTHFQDELLVSIATYHSLALAIARNRTEGFPAALMVNAISSHYLQDLFAPGHIVTERALLTDTVAAATHDFRNNKGAHFYVHQTLQSGGALEMMRKMVCLLDKSSPAEYCDGVREASTLGESRTWVLCALLRKPDENYGCALEEVEEREGKKRIREAVARMTDRTKDVMICVKGDGLVWRTERDGCDDGLEQRLFVVAAELSSIMEIVSVAGTAAGGGGYVNSLDRFGWSYVSEGRGVLQGPRRRAYASLGLGSYSIGQDAPEPVDYYAQYRDYGPGGVAPVPASNPPPRQAILPAGNRQNIYFDNLYRVSFARESFYKGNRVGRNAVSGEIQPYWRPVLNDKANLGLGVGLVRTGEKDVHAGGAMLRGLATFPDTESTFSAWTRRMHHTGNAERGWRNGWGLGYEVGFTSFFALQIGVGRDYSALAHGALEKGTVFYGGFAITLPQAQFEKWGETFGDKLGLLDRAGAARRDSAQATP